MGTHVYVESIRGGFLEDTDAELKRATERFGVQPLETLAVALMEEVGELAKEIIEFSRGNSSRARIREEGIQVAAMAYRIIGTVEHVCSCGDPDCIKGQGTHTGDATQ